ncbi:hypothetical protein [Bacillus sp. B1-b2]|uniref:hypothetical protein n=1 Tax=Bacillus sp. B1-b2 TaxID=2653201 RepID=UPI00126266A3|nr:hypothetical protein [Bacillus sp. B1-b2]KAB7667550.1 hypothetical protein F9279_14905 [Bacillus sp. B1-b2]
MEEKHNIHEFELEEKENELEEKEEVDHLSKFMFGATPLRRENRDSHSKIQPNEPRRRKGDAWILGANTNRDEAVEEEIDSDDDGNINAIMNYIDQIDIALLMKNVELFMTSANEIKPLLKDLSPLLKKWID